MNNGFLLHERLAAGSADIGCHGICRVLLKNQAHFPWLLLVPMVPPEITELHHLSDAQYTAVTDSIRVFSHWMEHAMHAEKVNVAAIGNQVRQLHIHIVGRNRQDIAWPGVVWSCPEKIPYAEAEHERIKNLLRVVIDSQG